MQFLLGIAGALCCISVDIDAVAGWLGSYGGEDSMSDISRGLRQSQLDAISIQLQLKRRIQASSPAALAYLDFSNYLPNMISKPHGSSQAIPSRRFQESVPWSETQGTRCK